LQLIALILAQLAAQNEEIKSKLGELLEAQNYNFETICLVAQEYMQNLGDGGDGDGKGSPGVDEEKVRIAALVGLLLVSKVE
jgi:hypothetical protein